MLSLFSCLVGSIGRPCVNYVPIFSIRGTWLGHKVLATSVYVPVYKQGFVIGGKVWKKAHTHLFMRQKLSGSCINQLRNNQE